VRVVGVFCAHGVAGLSFRTEMVVFFRPTMTPDPYSSEPTADWDLPVPVMSDECLIEPVSSTEPSDLDRQAVITGFLLKFTHLVTVSRLWRVNVRGRMCTIEGEPAVWHAPKSDLTDTLIRVEIVSG